MGKLKKRNVAVVVYYWCGEAYRRGENYYYDTTETNIELIEKTLEFYKKFMKGSVPFRVFVEQEGEDELQEIIDNAKEKAKAAFRTKERSDTIKQFADRLKRYYDENEKYLGYSIAYNIDRVAEELIKGAGAPDNKCVSCGETIPEGRQVCPGCEGGKNEKG